MINDKTYWAIVGYWQNFTGQRGDHDLVENILKLKRLANRHQLLSELMLMGRDGLEAGIILPPVLLGSMRVLIQLITMKRLFLM